MLDETIEILGAGLANLVNLFNPEKIIIGGWIGLALADIGLARIEHQVRCQSLHSPGRQLTLEVSELGNYAVSLGAGILPFLRLIMAHLSIDLMLPTTQRRLEGYYATPSSGSARRGDYRIIYEIFDDQETVLIHRPSTDATSTDQGDRPLRYARTCGETTGCRADRVRMVPVSRPRI